MKTRFLGLTLGILVPAFGPAAAPAQTPLDAGFLYQGRLTQGGQPATGTYDMQFKLYGSLAGSDLLDTHPDAGTVAVDADSGLFTVRIDFDESNFDGDKRWLELIVEGTTLSPRQELAAVPYATHAVTAGGLTLPYDASAASAGPVLKVKNTGVGGSAEIEAGAGGALYVHAMGSTGQPGMFAIENAANPHGVLAAVTWGLGPAGLFDINNAANSSLVLEAKTNGTGTAAYMHIDHATSTNPVLRAETAGKGDGGRFVLNNSANGNTALYAETKGFGYAVKGYVTGLGRAGLFEINRSDNGLAALEAKTNGSGRAAVFHIENPNSLNPTLDVRQTGKGDAGFFWITNVNNDNEPVFAQTDGIGPAGWFTINNISNGNPAVAGQTNGTGYAGQFSGGKGVWIAGTGTATLLHVDGRATFGLGAQDATERVDVNGTARLRTMPTGTGTTVVADANGVLKKQSSSQRYKDNIRSLLVDPADAYRLRPVRFTWKETGEEDVGLIAEEVEAVIPDLVLRDAQGRSDGVKYDRVGVYLLEVVKSQHAQITAQEQRLAALEQELAALRAELRAGTAAVQATGSAE